MVIEFGVLGSSTAGVPEFGGAWTTSGASIKVGDAPDCVRLGIDRLAR